MKKLLTLLVGLMLIGGSVLAYDGEVIGTFLNTGPPDAAGNGTSTKATAAPNANVLILFYVMFPTDWDGEAPDAGISYYEFQVTAPGLAACVFYDTANVVRSGAYSGGKINVAYNVGVGTPYVPGANGHIYIGYMICTVPTTGTVVNVSVGPNPNSTEFTVHPNIGPGIKCGSNAALLRTIGNAANGNPNDAVPVWTGTQFTINTSAPVENENTTWSSVKALYN